MKRLARVIVPGRVLTLTWVAAGLIVWSTAAGAATSPPAPFQVESTSLTQDGQMLVWQVELTQPFSPGALARDRRALCLLIDASRSGILTEEVCITGPAVGTSRPRVNYVNITGGQSGPPQPVQATITRSNARELTASFLPSAVGLTYRPLYWQVISSLRAAACAPRSPNGRGCFELSPPTPARLALHEPALVGCVASGPSLVYHGPSAGREIALTFDDGPWNDPPTLDFLRVLEREHVPATFFEIGRQLAPYDPRGVLARRMLADGDMIGDHSWSHPDVAALAASAQRRQLVRTLRAIRRATDGFTPCLWRPPYGTISRSLVRLARSLGLLTVMWNVDPRDWTLPGVGAIYANVAANASPGAIVIQHFGGGPRLQTLAALPREIATLRRRGYEFVTVAQLLGLKLLYR